MVVSPSRYSKSKIFTDYKELHNKKNIKVVNRSDKRFFVKQSMVVNKDKRINKRSPCWAS